jgi:hypothetical protein
MVIYKGAIRRFVMHHTISRFLKLGLAFCIAATLVGCASGGRHSYNDPFAYCAAVGTIDTADGRYNGGRLPDSVIQAMIRQIHGLSIYLIRI